MLFSKVIFVGYLPITDKLEANFHMNEIRDSGIEVEYWDVSFIREIAYKFEDYQGIIPQQVFHSYSEVRKELSHIERKSTLFVSCMTYDGIVLRLFLIFTLYRCIIAAFGNNTMPMAKFSYSKVLRSSKLTVDLFRRAILNKLSKYLKVIQIVRGFDYIFVSGRNGLTGIGRHTKREVCQAGVININSDDYDIFLEIRNRPRVNKERYILFLDQYFPLHPDLEFCGIKAIDADNYYSLLNNWFSALESYFHLPVVIAAHPKAIRYKSEDFFDGRKVVYNETANYCKEAEFVIAHNSTSINYAVVFEKPIVFLTSLDIDETMPYQAASIRMFADYLNKSITYMDNPSDISNISLKIDKKLYEDYKYEYLTSIESENNFTKDIVIRFLKDGSSKC